MHTSIWKSGLPDQQSEFYGQVGEFVEACAELGSYICVQPRGCFGGREAFRGGLSRLERFGSNFLEQRRVLLIFGHLKDEFSAGGGQHRARWELRICPLTVSDRRPISSMTCSRGNESKQVETGALG